MRRPGLGGSGSVHNVLMTAHLPCPRIEHLDWALQLASIICDLESERRRRDGHK